MALLEFISGSDDEAPLKVTGSSYMNFRWLVALPLAIFSIRFPFWKAEELLLLKALFFDIWPGTVGHFSSWLTPPFLFLILNIMIVAILFSSGLFSTSSIRTSELTVATIDRFGNSSSTNYQDDPFSTLRGSKYASTLLVNREESFHADTPSSPRTIEGVDILKTDKEDESTSDFTCNKKIQISSGSKRPIQTLQYTISKASTFGDGVTLGIEFESNIFKRMKSLDDKLLSTTPSIFDFTDSGLTVQSPAKKFRSSSSEKLDMLWNDCKASPSPIKGRVSIELDDLHERIESFIATSREQMRKQEQVASTMYSQRYVGNDYGW